MLGVTLIYIATISAEIALSLRSLGTYFLKVLSLSITKAKRATNFGKTKVERQCPSWRNGVISQSGILRTNCELKLLEDPVVS